MFDCSVLSNESIFSSVEALKNYSLYCSDTLNVTSSDSAKLPAYFHAIATILYACIFVLGVVGNFLVFYVVLKFKDMRDNIFHVFLA